MASSGDHAPLGKNPPCALYCGATRPPTSSAAPITINTTIVASLIIENQNSTFPYDPTLSRLIPNNTTEKIRIHTYDRTPGNHAPIYVAAATISVPIASARPTQYPARAMNPANSFK